MSWKRYGRVALPVVLIVVLAATFMLGRVSRRTGLDSAIDRIAAVRPGDVARVRIEPTFSRPGAEPFVLFRVSEWDGWAVRLDGRTLPARTSRVEDFIERVLATRPQRVVTRDPAHHAELYVARRNGDSVSFIGTDEAEPLHLLYGLPGRDGASLYVRLYDEPTVYAVDPTPSFFLSRETTYWADTRLFPSPIDLETVQSIRYGDADAIVREYREGQDVWRDRETAFETAWVQTKLRALFALQADSIHRSRPFSGESIVVRFDDRSEYVVTYTRVDDDSIAVTVRGPRLYGTGADDVFVYVVPSANLLAAIPGVER